MRQLIIYTGLACFVVALLAANLPNSALFAPSPEARKSDVISEFINLSAAPSDLSLDFLNRQRLQRQNREARLDHIHPDVLQETARATDLTVEEVRAQLANPEVTSAFDYTGVIFDAPNRLRSGQAGPWSWVLVTERSDADATADPCGLTAHCGVWLLYWTAESWYYAPVAHPELNAMILASVPEFEAILRDELVGY